MLTEFITDIAVKTLETTGHLGAVLLMAGESMIFPIPSEAVMPFVGFLVADGKWSLPAAVASTTLGSIIGSLLSYIMGYYGGKPLVLKLGRFCLLDQHHLELTERFFHRKGGALTIFIGRFVPVVRHLISIPAGIGKMPLVPFLVATTIGATLWNGALLYAGMKLRDHWTDVKGYTKGIDVFIVIAMLAFAAWWIYKHRCKKR